MYCTVRIIPTPATNANDCSGYRLACTTDRSFSRSSKFSRPRDSVLSAESEIAKPANERPERVSRRLRTFDEKNCNEKNLHDRGIRLKFNQLETGLMKRYVRDSLFIFYRFEMRIRKENVYN